ncbi:MAG: RimK family alpha-L-glutamate ligase [Planctomycetota bacterium]
MACGRGRSTPRSRVCPGVAAVSDAWRVAVLSKSAIVPSTALLLAAIRRSGHEPLLLEILRGVIALRDGEELVSFAGVAADELRADRCIIIPRVGSFLPELGLALLGALERRGAVTPNTSEAIRCARNKRTTIERLSAARLPTPATVYLQDFEQIDAAIRIVGGPPVIVKPVVGSQGRGVELLESWSAARAGIHAVLSRNQQILIQEYVAQERPSDLRLFVIGGRMVAAMRRRAAPGRVQANLHRGGSAERCEPTAETRDLACRAARVAGLEIAGVDIIESARGPLVLEVNPAPGLEGISAASGIDVAGEIVAFVLRSTEGVRSQ